MVKRIQKVCIEETFSSVQSLSHVQLLGIKITNQNYKKKSSHVNSNGHLQKLSNNKMLERLWRKGNPLTLLVGM